VTDSANLNLVRSIYGAWERGDYRSVEWAYPEIEFLIADGPAPGAWTGLAGMAAGWRTWVSAWEEFRVEAEEYRELDGERCPRPQPLWRAWQDEWTRYRADAGKGGEPVSHP
jgi:hypothetical protein